MLLIVQIGSWAGNLMLTHDNANFPSDVFTIMVAVGALVVVGMVTRSLTINSLVFRLINMYMSCSLVLAQYCVPCVHLSQYWLME